MPLADLLEIKTTSSNQDSSFGDDQWIRMKSEQHKIYNHSEILRRRGHRMPGDQNFKMLSNQEHFSLIKILDPVCKSSMQVTTTLAVADIS